MFDVLSTVTRTTIQIACSSAHQHISGNTDDRKLHVNTGRSTDPTRAQELRGGGEDAPITSRNISWQEIDDWNGRTRILERPC